MAQTGDDGLPEAIHEVHHHSWQSAKDDFYLCTDGYHYAYPGHSDGDKCIACKAPLANIYAAA